MNSLLLNILSFLTITVLITSCKEQEPKLIIKSIPPGDRCIFSTGDQILYTCSDGTTDTVRVNEAEFYTLSYSEEDLFGTPWNFRVDHQRISLFLTDTSWLRILHYACYNPEDCNSCVNMETDSFVDDFPTTHAYFGCEAFGGLVFATGLTALEETVLNGQSFRKVYSWNHSHPDTEGFRMYWSLKYGIIRFEGEIEDHTYTWDLIIPK